jgi:topoisomerase IA-like protein
MKISDLSTVQKLVKLAATYEQNIKHISTCTAGYIRVATNGVYVINGESADSEFAETVLRPLITAHLQKRLSETKAELKVLGVDPEA